MKWEMATRTYNGVPKIEIEWYGKPAGYRLVMYHKEKVMFSSWFMNVEYNFDGKLCLYNENWKYLGIFVVKDINNLEQLLIDD